MFTLASNIEIFVEFLIFVHLNFQLKNWPNLLKESSKKNCQPKGVVIYNSLDMIRVFMTFLIAAIFTNFTFELFLTLMN